MEAHCVEECRRFLTVARASEWYALFGQPRLLAPSSKTWMDVETQQAFTIGTAFRSQSWLGGCCRTPVQIVIESIAGCGKTTGVAVVLRQLDRRIFFREFPTTQEFGQATVTRIANAKECWYPLARVELHTFARETRQRGRQGGSSFWPSSWASLAP
jgi:hypothetical protein